MANSQGNMEKLIKGANQISQKIKKREDDGIIRRPEELKDCKKKTKSNNCSGTSLYHRKECSLSFPRRVFLPWLADTFLCDYIQPSESVEVLKDHFAELMSIEFPNDSAKILEPETEASALVSTTTKSFREVSTPYLLLPKPDNSLSRQNRAGTSLGSDQKSTKPASFSFTIAVSVLVISIILGVVLFVIRSS